eukprot:1027853-Amphidinium_carterae.1
MARLLITLALKQLDAQAIVEAANATVTWLHSIMFRQPFPMDAFMLNKYHNVRALLCHSTDKRS